MISKECFVDLINYVKKYNEKLDGLPDWIIFDNFPLSNICGDILEILEKEMGLSEENGSAGLIFIWCYNCNFGTEYRETNYISVGNGLMRKLDVPEPGYLITVDGVKYAPSTAEELYDCLTRVFCNSHIMHLDKEPCEKILNNEKNIELRLYDEKRKNIKVGDIITFLYEQCAIKVKVTKLHISSTFEKLFETIHVINCGGYTSKDMEKYYSLDEQMKNGVVGIEFEKII